MKTINPKDISVGEFHSYLLGAVAPRPIAFASTIDAEGQINLSPFSFFNAFGSNPPLLIFSPNRRVRDGSTKHSFENVQEVPEVVINIIDYALVEQMSLASTEYDKGVNEFVKAGLSQTPSEMVKPPRVAEAPVAFECKVRQIIETGQAGGAANLVLCEVVLAHFREDILDGEGKIDPLRLDSVGRMGGNYYCRASGEALFEIAKPIRNKGIGIDQIPETIRLSKVLTGNNLGQLGNVEQLPNNVEIEDFAQREPQVKSILESAAPQEEKIQALHQIAQQFLAEKAPQKAWKTLLQLL